MESESRVPVTETAETYANRLVVGRGTFNVLFSIMFALCVSFLASVLVPKVELRGVAAISGFLAGLTGIIGVIATIEHCAYAIVRAIAEKKN